MTTTEDNPISAQVVLRTESAEFSKAVKAEFERASFSVGDQIGNNFSIAAPRELFETYFDVKLDVTSRGEIQVSKLDAASRYELPADALPPTLRDNIEVVLFTPLPDFGPGNY